MGFLTACTSAKSPGVACGVLLRGAQPQEAALVEDLLHVLPPGTKAGGSLPPSVTLECVWVLVGVCFSRVSGCRAVPESPGVLLPPEQPATSLARRGA